MDLDIFNTYTGGNHMFDTLPILQVFPLTKNENIHNLMVGSLQLWDNLKKSRNHIVWL